MYTYLERQYFFTNPAARRLLWLIHDKQTNLAVSADICQKKPLLELIDAVGSEICVLKTHIDILEDFDELFIKDLVALAKKHRFLIFEDRKFADIGSTVVSQYEKGIYKIAQWADITNAHILPGTGIVEALKKVGSPKGNALLLLAQMSSKNNLLTPEYTQETIQLARQHPDFVIGFIAQKKLLEAPGFLYFTPGVHLDNKTDKLNQQYITPWDAIVKNQTDVIIVGRGILAAKDPREAAKKYKKEGWDAYLHLLQYQESSLDT